MCVEYVGADSGVSVHFTRLKRERGATYRLFENVSLGDVLEVNATAFGGFKRSTGVAVRDAGGAEVCVGALKSCESSQVGEAAKQMMGDGAAWSHSALLIDDVAAAEAAVATRQLAHVL